LNISICLSDIPKEYIYDYNGKKYTKITAVKKREPDNYGKTHYLKIDTWRPEQKTESKSETPPF